MSDVLIRGGRVIDPASKLDAVRDVLVREGVVAEVGEKLSPSDGVEVIDASGLWIVPGLVDIHVHLREPGGTPKETIFSGAEAAAAGGFAAILAMPNTQPSVDKGHLVRYVLSRGREASAAEVMTSAALTEGRGGKAPADLAGLVRAGAVAFTDDGDEVAAARLLHACMKEAARLGVPVLCHAEEPSLVDGGVMNEGAVATELGLPGRPALAEEMAVARDLALAADTGARVHIQHVSTRGALSEIRSAREGGLAVTCEATPHHLLLTEDECRGYDPSFKMNPPLRTEADRAALVEALADGTVDVIATDHAPHTGDEKGLEFDKAASGVVGLETALGLVMTEFVSDGTLSPARMVELMSLGPARILGRSDLGTLSPGARGHVTVIDPECEWTVDSGDFRSRSRNTPFAGRALRGRAVATVVDGRIVFRL